MRGERRRRKEIVSEEGRGRRVIQGNKQSRREDFLCEEGKNGRAREKEAVIQSGSQELGQGRI
jgi:hypothetical protein